MSYQRSSRFLCAGQGRVQRSERGNFWRESQGRRAKVAETVVRGPHGHPAINARSPHTMQARFPAVCVVVARATHDKRKFESTTPARASQRSRAALTLIAWTQNRSNGVAMGNVMCPARWDARRAAHGRRAGGTREARLIFRRAPPAGKFEHVQISNRPRPSRADLYHVTCACAARPPCVLGNGFRG